MSLPAGWGLVPADDLRKRDAGRVLIGGSPLRVLRLSAGGARLTRAWFGGQPVSPNPQHQELARRLLDAGMAWPRPSAADDAVALGDVTVVIPVRDDPDGLAITLAGLAGVTVIVVDDGSRRPVTASTASHRGAVAEIVRRPDSGGPGPARNTGLDLVTTDIVAFVDAGVSVTAADLRALRRQLDDSTVVAIAPRVACSPGTDLLSRYERTRSPLDLGLDPAVVGPGRAVSYVPTACLMVRTEPLLRRGGFDPGLRFGEDVDLVWDLAGDQRVRFDPSVIVTHPARSTLGAFVRQRIGYGSAAASLHRRHPGAVAPVQASLWSYVVGLLCFAGHPLASLVVGTGTAMALAPRLGPLPDARVEAAILTGRGHHRTFRSLARSALRAWWPFTALLLVASPTRRSGIALVLVGWLQRLADRPKDPLIDLTVGLIDDLSYGTGVWRGALAERTIGPLVPKVTEWLVRRNPSGLRER